MGHDRTELRQDEVAMQFVLSYLKHSGQVPRITRRAIRRAVRICGLTAEADYWHDKQEDGWRNQHLEAAGFDPITGRVVDYEKYYAHREAWAERKSRWHNH